MIAVRFRRPLILATLIILFGCGGDRQTDSGAVGASVAKPQGARPSQILVTIEAFAGRRASPFGGPVEMSHLAALVSAGTTYDDAVSTTTLARPALVTILTGESPDRSGVRDNIHDALPAALPTLSERAKGAGYETAAFVSTPFASYSSGLQRGFDVFDGPEAIAVGPAQHAPPVVKPSVIARNFKEWLTSRSSGGPYFAWIHLAELNALSVPLPLPKIQTGDKVPNEFAGYDAALSSIDRALGEIVDAVHADSRSSKVEWTLVGTHGTYFGESGRYGDAFWLADETLRVPLARIASSGATPSAARHDTRPTWLPDVAATLANAMGIQLDQRADGVPLDAKPAADRARLAWGYALDDQLGWLPQTAVREGNGFVVFTADVDGKLSAVGPAGEAAKASAASRPALPRRRVLPAEARAAVERAGLKLGTSSAPILPKKPDEWLRDLQIVRHLEGLEKSGIAARRSKVLLEREPGALASLVTRIYFFASTPNKTGPELQSQLLARFPERSDALHWAAHVSLIEKNYAAASALFDAALAVGPVEPEMYYDRACVRSLLGDPKAALAELDRALAAGYRNWDWIDKDPDLAATRADAGFPVLLQTHGR